MADPKPAPPSLEERVAQIERLIERAVKLGRAHPAGRVFLRLLGL